ncbi:MAG: YhcB family protein [Treponema sp.]|nr:YhcB family protein [Treponema sp.]
MNDKEVTIKFTIPWSKIIPVLIAFVAGALVVVFIMVGQVKTSKAIANDFQQRYNELAQQSEENEQRLVENNLAMIETIDGLRSISDDMGSIMSRQSTTIDAALQMIRDMRTVYQRQRMLLYE